MLDGVDITDEYFSRCSSDGLRLFVNLEDLFGDIFLVLLCNLVDSVESHNFGQTGNLGNFFKVISDDDLP